MNRENSAYTSIEDPEDYHIETPNFNQMAAHNDGTRTDPPQKSKYPEKMMKGGARPTVKAPEEASPQNHNKFNSTSTMYINDTLNSPNVDELLRWFFSGYCELFLF